MTDVITESQVYVPENPGNAVTNEWLIRELNRVAWTLQNVIHYKQNIGDAEWTDATLENGWVANANQPVQFRRTSAGVLCIRGRLITKGTAVAVFTLPEGYRPSQNETFSQTWNVTGFVTSRLAVQTTGLVTLLDDGVTAIDNASVSCSCYIG